MLTELASPGSNALVVATPGERDQGYLAVLHCDLGGA